MEFPFLSIITLSPIVAAVIILMLPKERGENARMLALSEELRCVVCQNESLAGSQAPLAQDLRQEIRDMMDAGMSDHQIVEFFVERYGDFVLYNPPLKPVTYMLWFGPAILFVLGFIAVFLTLRKRRASEAASLSVEDHRRAKELLDDGAHRE